MKTFKLLFFFFIPLVSLSQSTDTLLYERFETGGASFTLNTPDMGGAGSAVGYNQWIINNEYTGGSGQLICIGIPFNFNVNNTASQPAAVTGGTNTNYMHIVSDAAQASGIDNCNYLASDGICNFDENNFSRMTQDVSTTGFDSVSFSFLWICAGGTSIYGEVYYSIDSGTSWNVITTPVSQYRNQSNWVQQIISLPAFAQQNTLRFGFRFVNQQSNTANDPGFGIDEVLITASVASPAPVALFSSSVNELCDSGCVDFFDMSIGAPSSWLWIFQGAITSFSTQQNPMQICYNAPGTYDVTLIVTNGSGTDTLTSSAIVVNPNPPVPVISLLNDTLFSTTGYSSYQWLLNGNVIVGSVDSFHVVLTDGAYTVEVTDTNGCSSVSDTLNFTTGIAEYGGMPIFVYPNPVANTLHVNMKSGSLKELTVYNTIGKRVNTIVGNQTSNTIDVAGLSPGIYLIKILTADREAQTFKFIKQ